ncbi:glutathione S-transferase domain-containing protein [Sphingobium phenoxybenzoativorans]|uniref:Glutathione S-transferase domain-containing protein n=2 Tax=Sphingobium phenoxybenzoativorans TaxID=1592790 RepID=A0A975Q395_9SPHN|nr:glutathione S-transferase domain-containing protein [Sphingobium phenoxybenzoativorans]
MKVRLFLLEAGLLPEVDIKAFDPDTPDERSVSEELAPHFEKITYPSVKLSEGEYINGSDDIIALFAKRQGLDVGTFGTLQDYTEGVFEHLVRLYRENIELKARLG